MTWARHRDDRRALKYRCPVCRSVPGSPCTDAKHRPVDWMHFSRTALMERIEP